MSQFLSRPRPAEPAAVELVNVEVLGAEIAALAEEHRGREAELRLRARAAPEARACKKGVNAPNSFCSSKARAAPAPSAFRV